MQRRWFASVAQVSALVFLTLSSLPAVADAGVKMELTPAKCVSLRQGQDCHARVELTWQSRNPLSICLFLDEATQPLQCWQQRLSGVYKGEIITQHDRVLSLKTRDGARLLASRTLVVAWVYRQRRPGSIWRLF